MVFKGETSHTIKLVETTLFLEKLQSLCLFRDKFKLQVCVCSEGNGGVERKRKKEDELL